MQLRSLALMTVVGTLAFASSVCAASASAAKAKASVFDATLEAQSPSTPELSTQEFQAFLAAKAGIVLDARPKLDFDAAHVPGSVSIEDTGLLRIVQALPAQSTPIVVYADGPFSDRARRQAGELLKLGCTNVARYQLGIAVWRALGNTAETTLEGLRQVFHANLAVFVDVRSRAEYAMGTMPGAETVLAGDLDNAAKHHRLQYYDRATRIVVFGNSGVEARTVAEEIARHAYSNSSFFGGTYQELKRARFFSERKPSPFSLDGLSR
jgi:rhodanese-related sulfurtransferase